MSSENGKQTAETSILALHVEMRARSGCESHLNKIMHCINLPIGCIGGCKSLSVSNAFERCISQITFLLSAVGFSKRFRTLLGTPKAAHVLKASAAGACRMLENVWMCSITLKLLFQSR